MTHIKLGMLAAALALLSACGGPASDGRYATFDHGRSNNRAEALPAVPPPLQAAQAD
jgi:hypothetical protein